MSTSAYLILKDVTVNNDDGESFTHSAGSVVSLFEVKKEVRERIESGEYAHYRSLFEPLTEDEAEHHRTKATVSVGALSYNGVAVEPPFPDYVGLHPETVLARMKATTDQRKIEAIRNYERAYMNRRVIVEYTPPIEREPWLGYSELGVGEVLAKMAVLSDSAVQEVINYERLHRKRPAVITFEKEVYEPNQGASTESETKQEGVPAAA